MKCRFVHVFLTTTQAHAIYQLWKVTGMFSTAAAAVVIVMHTIFACGGGWFVYKVSIWFVSYQTTRHLFDKREKFVETDHRGLLVWRSEIISYSSSQVKRFALKKEKKGTKMYTQTNSHRYDLFALNEDVFCWSSRRWSKRLITYRRLTLLLYVTR